MTKEEAIIESRKGHKITHEYFSNNEWMIVKGARVIFEDGVSCYIDEFFRDRTGDKWKSGWSLFEPNI